MNNQLPVFSVSVVITAYNAVNWISETLDSILTQTYPVSEVLVVDDGSVDKTAEVVLSYPKPIKYIYQNNCGQPVARNHGIRLAKGHFVAFVDADDYWHPCKIEAQINLLRSRNLGWVICDAHFFDSISRQVVSIPTPPMREGDVLETLLLSNFIVSPTPVIKRSIFEEVGYFNESPEARIGEDWDFWLRVAARFPVGLVPEKLAYIRVHPASMMATTLMAEKVKSLVGVVERAVDREPSRLISLKNRALANIYNAAGIQLMKQNKYKDAREFFFHGLQYRPLNLESLIYLFISVLGSRVSSPIIRLKRFVWDGLPRFFGKR